MPPSKRRHLWLKNGKIYLEDPETTVHVREGIVEHGIAIPAATLERLCPDCAKCVIGLQGTREPQQRDKSTCNSTSASYNKLPLLHCTLPYPGLT